MNDALKLARRDTPPHRALSWWVEELTAPAAEDARAHGRQVLAMIFNCAAYFMLPGAIGLCNIDDHSILLFALVGGGFPAALFGVRTLQRRLMGRWGWAHQTMVIRTWMLMLTGLPLVINWLLDMNASGNKELLSRC